MAYEVTYVRNFTDIDDKVNRMNVKPVVQQFCFLSHLIDSALYSSEMRLTIVPLLPEFPSFWKVTIFSD